MFVLTQSSFLGHPEAASGIAAIIKTVLVLETSIIPPNMYPERISSFIATNCPNLKFPLTATRWPTTGVRRASVNSFGYGGTNVHVILDDALSYTESQGMSSWHRTANLAPHEGTFQNEKQVSKDNNGLSRLGDQLSKLDSSQCKLLLLSAFDEYAVRRSISLHEKWLQDRLVSEEGLSDLAYTLTSKRSSFPWKAYCVATSNSVSELSWSRPTRMKQDARLCFIFTGQGAIWHGMGRELCKFDAFRRSIHHADEYLRSIGSGWSVIGKDNNCSGHFTRILTLYR
jgi:acyl transferase domain-containing protein